MASRGRTTFEKRQKEMKRMEKQRMKAARRAERNLARRAEHTATDAPAFETDSALAKPEPQI